MNRPIIVSKWNKDQYLTEKGNIQESTSVLLVANNINFSGVNLGLQHQADDENSKETYLAWVKQWKRAYSAVTERIRFLKAARKKSHYQKLKDIGLELPDFSQFKYEDKIWIRPHIVEVEYSLAHWQKVAQALLSARLNMKKLSYHIRQSNWVENEIEKLRTFTL